MQHVVVAVVAADAVGVEAGDGGVVVVNVHLVEID